MVTLPKLSNSYACISLKTGTLVIGSLVIGTLVIGSLVIGSLNLVAFVIGIVASIGFMAAPTVGSAIIPHKLISYQKIFKNQSGLVGLPRRPAISLFFLGSIFAICN